MTEKQYSALEKSLIVLFYAVLVTMVVLAQVGVYALFSKIF